MESTRDYDLIFLCFVASALREDPRSVAARLREKLEELMRLEKLRRGLSEEWLVFVGMANVAEYNWCPAKAILVSREEELKFFSSYLYDRVVYSYRLGLTTGPPKSVEELLSIGDDIRPSHIERLLSEEARGLSERPARPLAPPPQLHGLDPIERGRALEAHLAERHPTIRWNFAWENYVVVGVPDGITEDFVYEFKTTASRFLLRYIKPVAFAQADLYGYFFGRRRKRVQVYIEEENRIETWDEPVNLANALGTLRLFKEADETQPPPPTEKWKCKRCKFREKCLARRA